MKKNTKVLLFLVAIFILGLGIWNLKREDQKISIQVEKTVQQFKANLVINDGQNTKGFDISGDIGKTALVATESVATVVTNGTGEKAFVTSIDGRVADTKKHEFWELDANGAETQVGAGSYTIQNGDKIEWKINTY